VSRPAAAAALPLLAIAAGLASRALLGHAAPLPVALFVLVTIAATAAALFALAGGTSLAERLASPVLFGLFVLWVWEMLVLGLKVSPVLLPPPTAVAVAFGNHYRTLAADFRLTYLHSVVIGYAIGCLLGFAVAIAIDRSPFLKRGFAPFASLMSAMPIVAIAPIMIMWFGFGWPSKAAVVVLMTFFPMLVSTTAGLGEAGAMEHELMQSYAAGYWATLIKLRLPAALPLIFTALKLNSTLALIGAVVAEFFGTPIGGMGFRISTEAARMDLGVVWATITVAALAGSISFGLIALLERAVTFWHPSFRTPAGS